jgi:hypothetical protein
MSNVRPHVNHFLANAAFGAPGSELQTRSRTCREWSVSSKRALTRRDAKTEGKTHYRRSLSAFSRLVGLAQAARPLAGGSPTAVLGRVEFPQNQLGLAAFRQTGRMNIPSEFRETLAHSMPQQLQPWVTEHQSQVRPNPSIERTPTGLARFTSLVYVPLRGPSRRRPAHVKR